ncbi:MAG: asparagine synthase (glutamine-hydrolyzing) [Sandaracinaceae bacterium]|nr:asparagine synthase (glutamine-hydrolyzing) [Sandaracinaceae bacterium]
MCGVVASAGAPAELAPVMRAALAALAHRGPDAEGLARLAGGRVWLGHRRLALVDPAGGAQPLASEDEHVFAVVNGEIYDDARLRARLEAKGHRFASRSDSELLVHLYEEHGDACVEHVRGELAFVLFDARRGRVLAGRDRFGIKPLYWAMVRGRLCLASELAALIALGLPPRWDAASMRHALAHQYLPPSRTLVAGAHAVPPGHVLVASLEGPPALRRYHELAPSSPRDAPSMASAAAEVRARLEEAVGLRVRGDAPVGAYLSGGLDSAAVVALAARAHPGLVAFGVEFERAPWDEGALAAASAAALGVPFEPVCVGQRDLVDGLAEAVRLAEGLAINGQLVAKHRLARAARAAGVRVVLTGEGADEAYLGYPHLRLDHYGAAAARAGDAIARGVMIPGDGDAPPLDAVERALGFVPSFVRAKAAFGARLTALVSPELARGEDPFERLFAELTPPPGAPVERAAWLWTRLALGGYIVRTLGDGTEMAASIEGRPPFLDHHVFEHAWSLPVALRLDAGGTEKAVLREALRGVVPEAVRVRAKQPFLAPPVLVDVYDDARALFLDAIEHAPFVARGAARAWIDGLEADDARAAADPVWTTLTSAGLLGRALGLSEVS